jgi:hypothetical protein
MQINGIERVTFVRALGPRGGLTQWSALLDGAPFSLAFSSVPRKFDTKREAMNYIRGYVQRHPEKFPK